MKELKRKIATTEKHAIEKTPIKYQRFVITVGGKKFDFDHLSAVRLNIITPANQ